MRTRLAIQMVLLGFAIQFVAYFLLAAPLGLPDPDRERPRVSAVPARLLPSWALPQTPSSPAYSDPRLPFAPAVFIAGVVLVFLAAVAYELLPDRRA